MQDLCPEALEAGVYLEILPTPPLVRGPGYGDPTQPQFVHGPATLAETWTTNQRERQMLATIARNDRAHLQHTVRSICGRRPGKSLSGGEERRLYASVHRYCRSHLSHRFAVQRQLRTYWSLIGWMQSRSPLFCTETLEHRLQYMLAVERSELPSPVALPSSPSTK